jgi:hypothetical protein
VTALTTLYNTDAAQLVQWIAREHGIGGGDVAYGNASKVRRETMAARLRLYRDKARQDIEGVICEIYESAEYQKTLKKYVRITKHQNVSRRIIDEVASLYDRPALRTLANDAEMDRFRAEEKRLRLHEVMQEAHRLLTLCNEVLIWQFKGIDGATRLRIVTPDAFDAIPHPDDVLAPAGVLIDREPPKMPDINLRARLPHFELWDDTFVYYINSHGNLVDAAGNFVQAGTPHNLGRVPAVLLHRREPTTCLLDGDTGADIQSGHLAVALLNVMIMRLSKSQGERQPVISGNLAALATGQVSDGERPWMLPPDVTASMLETRTDPDHYLKVKKDVIASLGNTYGMSYEQFSMTEGADAASGKAYQLRREKLSEIRQESRRRAVVNEALVVDLIGFDVVGMALDYQEQALPQDPAEELTLLKDKMRLGLDSAVSYLMRKDSDLSREDAVKQILANLEDWAMLVVSARALNAPMDGDAENTGKSPQENGAANGNAKPKPDLRAMARKVLNAA